MPIPYTFANVTSAIPLLQLDANFSYFTNAITVNSNSIVVGGSVTGASGWAGTGSSAGNLGGIAQSFACERNGVGAVGQIMSFGNGSSTGKGIRMPFAGRLLLATLAGTNITGTITVQAYQNGSVNSSYQLSGTGSASDIGVTQDFRSAPLYFAAGDLIGWYQAAAPTAGNVFNVTFYVIFS
jgi:hypothetical protein